MSDQQHRFALEMLELLPMGGWDTIIDIGAGPGYQAEWFAQQGKSVTAFDMVPPRVDVPYVTGDAHALPFDDESFDAAWTHHAFEHIRDPLGALLEVSRVLKPNGYLFFTVPQIEGVISSGHINSYDMPLVVYHLAMCGFDTNNGWFGKFRSHLRAVVRKIDTPAALDTSVASLHQRGRLPASCSDTIVRTGRFDPAALSTTWLDGSEHSY